MGRLLEQPRLFMQETIPADQRASQLWVQINEGIKWQDGIFYTLCGAYALLAAVALLQIIRIQLRVPEYVSTSQKVFYIMNFIVHVLRAVIFGFHKFAFKSRVLAVHVQLDLPGLLFFSTYTLIVLLWAQIYHSIQNSSFTETLRPAYCIINGAIYFIQVCIWIAMWIDDNSVVEGIAKLFVTFITISAAMGFLVYGGMLLLMLRRFPFSELRHIRKMLREIGCVTAICCACFFIRCLMVAGADSLDVMKHPILNLFYYMLVEILPSGLVLFILCGLPATPNPTQARPLLDGN